MDTTPNTTKALRIRPFVLWLIRTNPTMAASLVASAVEEMASLPSETEGKLVEVNSFDTNGQPLYSLTEGGGRVYSYLKGEDHER